MVEMTFEAELSQRLRNARTHALMTQAQLAQKIGVTANCISQYETSCRMPSVRTMSMLGDALGASMDYLIPQVPHLEPVDENQMDIYEILEG